MKIILYLGVTRTWETVLKSRSIRKVESHCYISMTDKENETRERLYSQ